VTGSITIDSSGNADDGKAPRRMLPAMKADQEHGGQKATSVVTTVRCMGSPPAVLEHDRRDASKLIGVQYSVQMQTLYSVQINVEVRISEAG